MEKFINELKSGEYTITVDIDRITIYSNGNDIYSKMKNGFWYKKIFDNNNNEIYYENSIGDIIIN